MEKGVGRTLLSVLLVTVGIFAAFFLWSLGSGFTYAGAIPVLAGVFLALGGGGGDGPLRPRAAIASLSLGWVALGLTALAGAGAPRPDAYFWLVPCSVGLLLLGTALDPRRWRWSLAGLALCFVLVRWSSYHAFATFEGNDSFFHARAAGHLVATGHVAAAGEVDKYALAPGMHLIAAMAKLATGLPIGDALFWSITLSHLALLFGLVALAGQVGQGFPALAVAALVTVDSTFIAAAVNFFPGAYTLVLFVPILLVLRQDDLPSQAVFFLAAGATVLIHQLSTFVILLCATVYALAMLVFGPLRKVSPAIPVLKALFFVLAFGVVNVVLAGIVGVDFVGPVMDTFLGGLAQAELGSVDQLSSVRGALASNFLYKLTLVFSSALAIAAACRLFLLPEPRSRSLGVAAGVALALAFGLPLLGISLVAERWLPLALLAGLAGGAVLLARWAPRPRAGFVVLVVVLAFFGVSQPLVSHDRTFYSEERNVQEQFDEPDLVAAAFLMESRPPILTDFGMRSIFRSYGQDVTVRPLAVSQLEGEVHMQPRAAVLLRDGLFEDGKLHFAPAFGGGFLIPDTPPEEFQRRLDLRTRFLDEGSITVSLA